MRSSLGVVLCLWWSSQACALRTVAGGAAAAGRRFFPRPLHLSAPTGSGFGGFLPGSKAPPIPPDDSNSSEKGPKAQKAPAKDRRKRGAMAGKDAAPFALTNSERLQKILAHAGVASRRSCEQMILDGRVKVNNKMVTTLGAKVDPQKDSLYVDGKRVAVKSEQELFWVALNKPKGAICSCDDERGRQTVMDLIPNARELRLVPVGRLDRDSAGVLLLTNDITWVNTLTHPSFGHEKVYRVVIERGMPSKQQWTEVMTGMMLPGEKSMTAPCDIDIIGVDDRKGLVSLEVRLQEGKNRQIRRMFEAIGHPVKSLTRIKQGPVGLKGMVPGEWRKLTPGEVTMIKRKTGGKAIRVETRGKKYFSSGGGGGSSRGGGGAGGTGRGRSRPAFAKLRT
jgi:23S rRNA pseudouridine2605 synthase